MSRRIGTHELEVEEDILKLTVHGAFTLDDMKMFIAIADEHAVRLGYLLVLNDINDAKSLSAEARRYSAENTRAAQLKGPVYFANASFGAGTLVRAMAALFHATIRLTSSGTLPTHIAKSEADARAFLAVQREYFHTQLKQR